MADSYVPAARRAAARLAADFGPDLPACTERALALGSEPPRYRSFDAGASIALAGVLLSAVQFGWQVYRDIKADREKKKDAAVELDRRQLLELLVRRLRPTVDGLALEKRDRLLEVVAEEILASEDPPG